MSTSAVRANCLDASALVKKYVKEEGSNKLKQYLQDQPTWYATLFCYFEALSCLKTKWKRAEMTKDAYLEAASDLSADFWVRWRQVKDLDFGSPTVYGDAQRIARRHEKLDLSDAFQILSVKEGLFRGLSGESKTILITADKDLAEAARQEEIDTWYFLTEPPP